MKRYFTYDTITKKLHELPKSPHYSDEYYEGCLSYSGTKSISLLTVENGQIVELPDPEQYLATKDEIITAILSNVATSDVDLQNSLKTVLSGIISNMVSGEGGQGQIDLNASSVDTWLSPFKITITELKTKIEALREESASE